DLVVAAAGGGTGRPGPAGRLVAAHPGGDAAGAGDAGRGRHHPGRLLLRPPAGRDVRRDAGHRDAAGVPAAGVRGLPRPALAVRADPVDVRVDLRDAHDRAGRGVRVGAVAGRPRADAGAAGVAAAGALPGAADLHPVRRGVRGAGRGGAARPRPPGRRAAGRRA
ncbi:MAG: hypothetical protein AVDCRST_MAG41-447, partial [uncultured Corynebacteriales bacterium]